MINTFEDNFKSFFGQAFDKIKEGFKSITIPADAEENKTVKFLERIIEGLPEFEKTGYRTTSFQVKISVPPTLELHFNRFKIATDEEVSALREELKDRNR